MRQTHVAAAVLALVALTAGCEPDRPMRCVGSECLPGPACESDADCDDGLVCNGIEICGTVSRRCVSGTPLDCDDGIQCTVDRCVEPDGSCVAEPNDGLCGDGEACTGIEGTGCIRSCSSGIACDPVSACGCRTGEACTYGATGAPRCAPAGTLGHGSPCSATSECAAGTQCIPLDGFDGLPADYAECRELCRSDSDCPSSGQCAIALPGTTTRACTRACDLVTQTGCASPARCHPVNFPGGTVYADCAVRGNRLAGQSCGTTTEVCAAGLICVTQTSGGALCDPICQVDRDCTGGRRCVGLVEMIVVDGETYGVCN